MKAATLLQHIDCWVAQTGCSIHDVVHAAGITNGAVYNWRRSPDTRVRRTTLGRVAAAMGCTVQQLTSGEPVDFLARLKPQDAPALSPQPGSATVDDRLFAAAVIMGTSMIWDHRDLDDVAAAAAAAARALIKHVGGGNV